MSIFSDSVERNISNSDTIPRGAYILNESEIVGVALYNLEKKDRRHLREILGSRNSIATLLQKHLVPIVGLNILITLLFLAINAIITK